MNAVLNGIKNVLLWSYARGSWQYDVLCLIIILIVFMVPSRYFGDRDRPVVKQANQERIYASKSAGIGAGTLVIDPGQLEAFLGSVDRSDLEKDLQAAIALYLKTEIGENASLIAYRKFTDSRGRTGYRVRYR
ncbi:MAG: hypothetical protein AB7H86_20615 [Blastocatellales bacterium]